MSSENKSQYYHGLVDMGSNGIRFSITDLSPHTLRNLPTIHTSRAGISLYDAQHDPNGQPIPIPPSTITAVISALLRFKSTCTDYNVPPQQTRILATEATRTAINSADFRTAIKEATGWEVEMLEKSVEGRVGAFGVASSYAEVTGLVMDLGGGSTQLTWLRTSPSGDVEVAGAGSVSLPYGAAALTRNLEEASKEGRGALKAFEGKVVSELKEAVTELRVPGELARDGGLTLYLSGGGFRGWGFVLMSTHPVSPYPIPIINGFHTTTENFQDTDAVQMAVKTASTEATPDIFRVSGRRASQVPAVAFLVKCLSQALPAIKDVYFCQGGVREGVHFSNLSAEERAQPPFVTATRPYAPRSTEELTALLIDALPEDSKKVISDPMLTALTQSMYAHAAYPKDLAAGSALRSTTTGYFAATHGVNHEQRALLSLMLCECHGGFSSISPTEQDFYRRIQRLLPEKLVWWALYIGRVASVLALVYPAGVVREERMKAKAVWARAGGKEVLCVDFRYAGTGQELDETVVKELRWVEKVGKSKNWVDGHGWKVKVTVGGRDLGND